MRAEVGKKGKGKRREKKKKKEEKMGFKIFFFFFFFFFFFKSTRRFFSYAQWSFFKYIRKTVSRLSRSYPLLFAIIILMVSQFGDF